MSREHRSLKLELSDGTSLESTAFLETLGTTGDLSNRRVTLKTLPPGFDPLQITGLVLFSQFGGDERAEKVAPQGAVDSESVVIKASFRRPKMLELAKPTTVKLVKGILVAKAVLTVLAIALLAVISVLPPSPASGALSSFQAGFLKQIGPNYAGLLGYVIGRSFFPMIGYVLGIKGINERRHNLLKVGLLFVVLGSAVPLSWLDSWIVTLGILALVFLSGSFKAYMSSAVSAEPGPFSLDSLVDK